MTATLAPTIHDAIAAFRDIAQERKRLMHERAVLEERTTALSAEIASLDQRYADAKKAMIDAVLEGE